MSPQGSCDSLGIGLVGLGWMGRLHAEAYARLPYHFPAGPRPRLIIAADELAAQAESALALGFAHVCQDWREVVAHPAVDALSIATPNDLHRDIACAAAEAGKHVWIEKPVGRSAGETEEIAAAVREAGVMSLTGFDLRFVPVLQHARALIADGKLGRLTGVRASLLTDFGCDPGAPLPWRFQRARAGHGALGDLMMHLIDLITFLVGPLRQVSSHLGSVERQTPAENDDSVVSLLLLEAGVLGHAEASRVSAGRRSEISLGVDGIDGSLSWRFDRMNELRVHSEHGVVTIPAAPGHGAFAAFQPSPGLPMGYDDLKVIEANAFVQAIVSGESGSPDVSEALLSARALEAMERSSQTRAWETVRPQASSNH